MLKEKCEEIIIDKKLAYEFYWRICEIEEDDRFTVVDDQEGRRSRMTDRAYIVSKWFLQLWRKEG